MISEWLEQRTGGVRDRVGGRWRAQSEVLGVALLTAIVVILIATTALFLFTDFASEEAEERLLASVESDMTSENITIQHSGGDNFDAEDISVIVQGDTSYNLTLDEFDEQGDDSFAPGSVWRHGPGEDTNLSNRGEMRLLVIDEDSNTILHDRVHTVQIQDVRLLVDGSENAAEVVGADPGYLDEQPEIPYTVQVRYDTGEGWVNQTGGTDAIEYDPEPKSLRNDPEDGVFWAVEPEDDVDVIDVRTWDSTSADDEDIYSNWVEVTVRDAELGANVAIQDLRAGDDPNTAVIDWTLTNTAEAAVPIFPAVDIEVTDGNETTVHQETVQRVVEDGDTISIETVVEGVDPDTEELTADIGPGDEWVEGDQETEQFDLASIDVTDFDASFDESTESIVVDYEVTNTGDWHKEGDFDIDATAYDSDGEIDSETLLDEEGITFAGGDTESGTVTYDSPPATTEEVFLVIDTTDDSESESLIFDPAEFVVDSVDAELVSVPDEEDFVEVEYTLVNDGDFTDTQDVLLEIDGSHEETEEDVTIDRAGGTYQGTFETTDFDSNVGFGDVETVTFTVLTDDDDGSDTIDIEGPDFHLDIDDAYADGEGNLIVNYTIDNVGGLEGTSHVDLRLQESNRVTDHRNVEVSGDEDHHGTFEIDISMDDVNEDGNVPILVDATAQTTTESEDEDEVPIQEPQYEFETSDFQLQTGTLSVEEYAVTNTGDVAGEPEALQFTTIADDIDGTGVIDIGDLLHEAEHELEIGAGETATGEFTGDEALDLGSLELTGILTLDLLAEMEIGDATADELFTDVEPAYYEVHAIEAGDIDFDDGDIAVDYTVENTGGMTGEQDIELLVEDTSGESVVATNPGVELEEGDFESGTFEYDDVDDTSAEVTVTVQTDNDEASYTYTVEPAYFEIDIDDAIVDPGDPTTATLIYEVENTGDFTADRDVVAESNSDSSTENIELTPGQTMTDTQSVEIHQPGPQDLEVYVAEEGSDTEPIVVQDAFFAITHVDAEFSASSQEAIVDYEIENTGELPATQEVVISSNNHDRSQGDLRLAPGEDHSVSGDRVSVSESGTQSIVVSTNQPDPDRGETAGDTITAASDFRVSIDSLDYDRDTEEVTVFYTVNNEGNLDDEKDVEITTNPGGSAGSATQEVWVAAGGSSGESADISVSDAGTIEFVVDTGDDTDSEDITIEAANLEFTDYNFPSSVSPGHSTSDELEVSYTLENTGDLEADSTFVDLHKGGASGIGDDWDGSYILGAGESESGSLSFDVWWEDAPSQLATLEITATGETVSETVFVDVEPQWDSYDAYDTGSVRGCWPDTWYGCPNNWEHEAYMDVTWSIDDPSNNFNRVEIDIEGGEVESGSGYVSGVDHEVDDDSTTEDSTSGTYSYDSYFEAGIDGYVDEGWIHVDFKLISDSGNEWTRSVDVLIDYED